MGLSLADTPKIRPAIKKRNGRAVKCCGLFSVWLVSLVLPIARSVQSTWRKRLDAPSSPAHSKELPAINGCCVGVIALLIMIGFSLLLFYP